MLNRFRGQLTFANVIALTALFFALGGTVYAANQISGSSIKPKTIPPNRIKPKSLSAAQIKAKSVTGAEIKPGSITGTQIKGSTITGVSAAALGSVQYVVATVAISPALEAGTPGTAACPAGTKAIGGGATVSNPSLAYINETAPTVDRNGWMGNAYSSNAGITMTVTAICTPVSAATG